MTTTAPTSDDDHTKRVETLKASVPAAPTTPAPPVAAAPKPDPTLIHEKTIDLLKETHAALAENRRILEETKAELHSLQANMPSAVAAVVRQAMQLLISANSGQRQDTDVLKQQTLQGLALHAECAGNLKALFWIWAVIGVAVLVAIGRNLWQAM
jgi:hypothetical protein